MFGFRNFTKSGFALVAKIGKVDIEFTTEMVEKITFNMINSAAAHANEIPQNINIKFTSKD